MPGVEVESQCQVWLTFNERQALPLTGVSHLILTLTSDGSGGGLGVSFSRAVMNLRESSAETLPM